MSERELEIGKQMGGNVFFVYHTLKKIGKGSVTDISIETGLNVSTVRAVVGSLENAGIVGCEVIKMNRSQGYCRFSLKKEQEWKLH